MPESQADLELKWCLRISRCLEFDEVYKLSEIEKFAATRSVENVHAGLEHCIKNNPSIFKVENAHPHRAIHALSLNESSSHPEIADRCLIHKNSQLKKLEDVRGQKAEFREALARQEAWSQAADTRNASVHTAARAEARSRLITTATNIYLAGKRDTPTACWKMGELYVDAGDMAKASQYKKAATLMACGEVCVKKGLPAPPWSQYTIAEFLYKDPPHSGKPPTLVISRVA